MKIVFSLAFLLLLTSDAFGQELKVASWNIQNFNENNKERKAADYESLKRWVKQNSADVWVLQEIRSKGVLRRIFPKKEYLLECEKRRGQHRVCAVFKKGLGLRFVRHADVNSLKIKRRGLRAGLDFTIHYKNKTLRVLGIHLKSGCFQEDPKKSKQKSCKDLAKQIPFLEEWIDRRAEESKPFIVVGDFNRRLLKKNDSIWKELDDASPKKLKLTSLAGERKNPCWNYKYKDFIDHIVSGRLAQKMVVPKSFGVYTFSKSATKKTHSDHCPIYASFRF